MYWEAEIRSQLVCTSPSSAGPVEGDTAETGTENRQQKNLWAWQAQQLWFQFTLTFTYKPL